MRSVVLKNDTCGVRSKTEQEPLAHAVSPLERGSCTSETLGETGRVTEGHQEAQGHSIQ